MSIEKLFSDLWVSAFWGPLVVGLILFWISRLFSEKDQNKTVTFKYVREVVVKHVIEVKRSAPRRSSSASSIRSNRRHNDDSVVMLLPVGLFFLSFFYAKYQIECIAVISGFSTFILSFISFTTFFGVRKNIKHDMGWRIYLIVSCCLALLGYLLMYVAVNPFYAPLDFENMRGTVVIEGVAGMLKSFGIKGVVFFMYQALGFMTLALAMFIQVLSLTFYACVIQIAISSSHRPVISFIARLTSRFESPVAMTCLSIFLYLMSFVLISGVGFKLIYSS